MQSMAAPASHALSFERPPIGRSQNLHAKSENPAYLLALPSACAAEEHWKEPEAELEMR